MHLHQAVGDDTSQMSVQAGHCLAKHPWAVSDPSRAGNARGAMCASGASAAKAPQAYPERSQGALHDAAEKAAHGTAGGVWSSGTSRRLSSVVVPGTTVT